MVLVVLGFDGLEFELVKEFSLRHLKQEAYCKTSLEDFSSAFNSLNLVLDIGWQTARRVNRGVHAIATLPKV